MNFVKSLVSKKLWITLAFSVVVLWLCKETIKEALPYITFIVGLWIVMQGIIDFKKAK